MWWTGLALVQSESTTRAKRGPQHTSSSTSHRAGCMSVHVRASARRDARAYQRGSTRKPELRPRLCHAGDRHGTRMGQLLKAYGSCEHRTATAQGRQREESTRRRHQDASWICPPRSDSNSLWSGSQRHDRNKVNLNRRTQTFHNLHMQQHLSVLSHPVAISHSPKHGYPSRSPVRRVLGRVRICPR